MEDQEAQCSFVEMLELVTQGVKEVLPPVVRMSDSAITACAAYMVSEYILGNDDNPDALKAAAIRVLRSSMNTMVTVLTNVGQDYTDKLHEAFHSLQPAIEEVSNHPDEGGVLFAIVPKIKVEVTSNENERQNRSHLN